MTLSEKIHNKELIRHCSKDELISLIDEINEKNVLTKQGYEVSINNFNKALTNESISDLIKRLRNHNLSFTKHARLMNCLNKSLTDYNFDNLKKLINQLYDDKGIETDDYFRIQELFSEFDYLDAYIFDNQLSMSNICNIKLMVH